MFFTFRTHLINQPFASNATSCKMQQLLLCYQIPQYDRHYFPVTGIFLIRLFSLISLLYENGLNYVKPRLIDGQGTLTIFLRKINLIH